MAQYASPSRPPAATRGDDTRIKAVALAPPANRALTDTAQRLNAQSPSGLRQAVAALSDRPVRQLYRSAAPIQRYAVVNGAKVSENEELCLVDTQELYAGADQFAEANQIPGMVHFAPGAQIGQGYVAADQAANLHRVTATLRPNARSQPFYGTDGAGAISSPTTQDIDDNTEYLNAHRRGLGTFNAGNNQQYEQSQIGRGGPLLPSDCDEASVFVTGMAHPEADPDNAPRPGNRYVHTPGGTDADQWAFHFAGIIMADGADHVTMENAGAKESENFSKRLMDKTWFYKMYGTAHGQSFAAAYGADLPGGGVSIQRPRAAEPDDDGDEEQAALIADDVQEQGGSWLDCLTACFRG